MPSVPAIAEAIRNEYLALPGLSLTLAQMQRMFQIDPLTCQSVTAALVDIHFLVCRAGGQYTRRDRTFPLQTAAPSARRPRDRQRAA